MFVYLSVLGCLVPASSVADDEHWGRDFFDQRDRHGIPFFKTSDKGNEVAGRIAVWLLALANVSVAMSILIKWTNRFIPLRANFKVSLMSFNRFQKKHLMLLHYYLNPVALGVAVWHYLSSRCVSTSLPEWALFFMISLVSFGILTKFRLCPKGIRKGVHKIHTNPIFLSVMASFLTIGHLILD